VKFSDEQFRDRLIDYLYGELEGDELEAFETRLLESESCRRELSALQETLGIARAALSGPLLEEPPARVRAALLAAAGAGIATTEREQDAATALRSPPASSAPTPLAQVHTLPARPGQEPSARKLRAALRTPWLLPTLGIAAAVAIVVLGKGGDPDALNERLAEQHQERARSPAAAPAPRESASEVPTESEESASAHDAPSPVSAAPAKRSEPAQPEAKRELARARSGSGGPPKAKAPIDPVASSDPASYGGGLRHRSAAPASPQRSEQRELPKRAITRTSEEASDFAEAPASASPSERDALKAAPTYAAPPPPTAAAPARSWPEGESTRGDEADSVGGAAAAERAPDELVERAREHFEAQRFEQAELAYRALLSRFSRDPRASEWRKRLRLAGAALDANEGGRSR
jgi:hypothetical protein